MTPADLLSAGFLGLIAFMVFRDLIRPPIPLLSPTGLLMALTFFSVPVFYILAIAFLISGRCT